MSRRRVSSGPRPIWLYAASGPGKIVQSILPPSVPSNAIATETNDPLVTESGDFLVTE